MVLNLSLKLGTSKIQKKRNMFKKRKSKKDKKAKKKGLNLDSIQDRVTSDNEEATHNDSSNLTKRPESFQSKR
jgi:hypothetical protein